MKLLATRYIGTALIFMVVSFGSAAQTVHFQSGNSMRNNQLSHYYKMVTWNDAQYQEAAYWLASSGGSVTEFMNWRIIFPPGYQQTGTTKYPMILMLHGAGESGRQWSGNFDYQPTDPKYDNNDANLTWGGQEHLQAVNTTSGSRSFPGIVVFPQASYNGAWGDTWNSGLLNNNGRMAVGIVEYLIANYNVDQHKIYIHGLSAGAKGVWDVTSKRPDLFAAMLPMSGVGSDINIETDIHVTSPLWLFQGGQDTNPSPGWAQQWITTLKSKGGNPRFTLYPNLDHGVWNTAYQEPDFFSWMRAQDKRNIFVFGGTTSLASNPSIKLGFSDGFPSYQWTFNGLDIPGATTRYYTATQPGSYAVRYVRRTDGVTDMSFPVQITTDQPPPPPPPTSGLNYQYYEYSGTLSNVSSFNFSQTPKATGTTNNFNINPRLRNSQYVLSFDGYLEIDNPGTYTFYTNSDDGSRLYINGALVVNNDGKHTARVKAGIYTFTSAGSYPIKVTYFQNSNNETLAVRYNQGTTNNYNSATGIPDNKLFQSSSSTSARYAAVASVKDSTQTATSNNIIDDSSSNAITAFPNPFPRILYVQFPDAAAATSAQLYDLRNNKMVKTMQCKIEDKYAAFDLSDMPSGPYVLIIGNSRFRVIKTD
ncbi:MAG TPA: PA14 domain-containing protein [Cyclobacteriaceae bacterium]|jgi:predicted esterase|nr:PA14 domain-containing protein [Cyclobacteriaceae bacterium]